MDHDRTVLLSMNDEDSEGDATLHFASEDGIGFRASLSFDQLMHLRSQLDVVDKHLDENNEIEREKLDNPEGEAHPRGFD